MKKKWGDESDTEKGCGVWRTPRVSWLPSFFSPPEHVERSKRSAGKESELQRRAPTHGNRRRRDAQVSYKSDSNLPAIMLSSPVSLCLTYPAFAFRSWHNAVSQPLCRRRDRFVFFLQTLPFVNTYSMGFLWFNGNFRGFGYEQPQQKWND